jgi:parallel beta-helix repeat protein
VRARSAAAGAAWLSLMSRRPPGAQRRVSFRRHPLVMVRSASPPASRESPHCRTAPLPEMTSLSPKLLCCIALALVTAFVVSSAAGQRPPKKRGTGRAAACDRVAAPGGSDRNRGSHRSPFATVSKLVAALRPGQTGCLLSGRFEESVDIAGSGRANQHITLRAAPGARATICGFIWFMSGAAYWRLSGLHVDGSCSSQMTVQIFGDHVTLDHDNVTNRHRAQSCVLIGSRFYDDGVVYDTLLQHNRIHDCGAPMSAYQHGIYVAASRNARITDNDIYANSGYGIHLYPDAQRTLVARNVIDETETRSGLVFAGGTPYASSDNLVTHNIFSRNGLYGIGSSWGTPVGSGNVAKANCFWKNTGGAFAPNPLGYTRRQNIGANPGFIAPNAGDYRLRRRSPCKTMQPRGHVGP